MKQVTSRYVCSATVASKWPSSYLPEFACAGRSNVGKSSLINMLAGNSRLARTSSTPGKTNMVNFYVFDEKWMLADLPGYGYAKVSKTERIRFAEIITDYILKRSNLYCLFVLIDSRLTPQESDLYFIRFLGENKIPFAVVFTKTDKLSAEKVKSTTGLFLETLRKEWNSLPEVFYTSSYKKKGKDEILGFIQKVISNRK